MARYGSSAIHHVNQVGAAKPCSQRCSVLEMVFNAEFGLASAGTRSDNPPGVFKDEVTEFSNILSMALNYQ